MVRLILGLPLFLPLPSPGKNTSWPGRGLLDLAVTRQNAPRSLPFPREVQDYLSPSYRASCGVLRGHNLPTRFLTAGNMAATGDAFS